jgi:hypothetical protein
MEPVQVVPKRRGHLGELGLVADRRLQDLRERPG